MTDNTDTAAPSASVGIRTRATDFCGLRVGDVIVAPDGMWHTVADICVNGGEWGWFTTTTAVTVTYRSWWELTGASYDVLIDRPGSPASPPVPIEGHAEASRPTRPTRADVADALADGRLTPAQASAYYPNMLAPAGLLGLDPNQTLDPPPEDTDDDAASGPTGQPEGRSS